ncbi:hypothetical protein B6U81_03945 [Thermoplasmatales archaeon ex4484_30]|nr:MAG: hypothetical protein B6U81_03945 [Thermoplasmatales archaeon ex4484_30]
MGIFSKLSSWLLSIFGKRHVRIGIYGPPNAGKTTLANRIAMDWAGEIVGETSEVPHETRKIQKKDKIVIKDGKASLIIDIVDTPGIATKVDFHDFLEYGLSEEEAKKREILVLEKGLTTEEQAKLIEMTMKDINDGFVGIEMESYMEERKSFWQKLFGKSRARMTVVGPADKLKTVYRDKDVIKAVIKAR